uniref:WW domain-containing protein n=1 Tax=Peronospora matthiolae TaxID=2874970 RepID=A0AAV1VAS8_9STRA
MDAMRGVHGASSGSLNERFIKCAGCNVNVPKDDMLSLGKCTVCGRPYGAGARTDGMNREIATVAFNRDGAAEVKKKRKRWAVLTSKRGRVYYHNTETGEDRWDQPADLDADAVEDAFVPFKNDAVKKAVLREQMKVDATKRGVPMEVVAAVQQQLQHEDNVHDSFDRMVERGGGNRREGVPVEAAASSVQKVVGSPRIEEDEDVEEQQEEVQTRDASGSCIVM